MFYRRSFDPRFLLKQVSLDQEDAILLDAWALFENDKIDDAHRLLVSLVSTRHPLALVMSSMYSRGCESEEEFEKRHIEQLTAADALECAVASFALGVYYDMGVLLEEDKAQAFNCFQRSADLGNLQAMHVYGIMLYYGTGGAEQDKERGLSMVKSAAHAGVVEAEEFLTYLDNM